MNEHFKKYGPEHFGDELAALIEDGLPLALVDEADIVINPSAPSRKRPAHARRKPNPPALQCRESVTITIPGAPRGKGRHRTRIVAGRAHSYTPEQTRNAEAFVKMLAAQTMMGRAPMEGPVMLDLLAVMPVPASWSKKKRAAALAGDVMPTGKPDLSNIIKLLEDGLNGVVFKDDAQIVLATIRKRYGEVAEMVATIRPIGDDKC